MRSSVATLLITCTSCVSTPSELKHVLDKGRLSFSDKRTIHRLFGYPERRRMQQQLVSSV